MLGLYCQWEGQIQPLQYLSMRSDHSSNLESLPYFHTGRPSCLGKQGPRIFRSSLSFVD